MRLEGVGADLTYCTNVHPGETWADTFAALERHLPAVKRQVSPDRAFGVGLRLSAEAAETLAGDEALERFKAFLAEHELYVFTINGFPYGRFHGGRVKENVYLPDWQDEARLAYTNRLADILAALLPDECDGSVSTVPGGFKPRVQDAAAAEAIVGHLVGHAAHLARLEERTGRTIRLALEPEPCCYLETVEESIRFFEDRLLSGKARDLAATATGRASRDAEVLLRRHIGICFDVCHAAVEFEADDALDRLLAAGIAVPKIQLSAALRLPRVDAASADLLRPFDDGIYFHQVVERNTAGLKRYVDLEPALATLDGSGGAREWRVHFHVPVFRDSLDGLATTQCYLRTVLARQRRAPVSSHLEVETYTWGVLPHADRLGDIAPNIARELEWVKRELAG